MLSNHSDNGIKNPKMTKIRRMTEVGAKTSNKGCTLVRSEVSFTEDCHFIPVVPVVPFNPNPMGGNERPDHRSAAEKTFFPIRVLGWTFDKNDSGKMIRFDNQTDATLNLCVEYDDHDTFLTECMNNGVIIRARDHEWMKLSYDFRDFIFIETANFKNRENRLQVQICVPKNVNFLLDAEIFVKTGVNAEGCDEIDENTKTIYGKINAIRKETEHITTNIQTASEFTEIFKTLENLFDAYEQNIFQFIYNIKCG